MNIDDGMAIGATGVQSNGSGLLAGPGQTQFYRWYAGDISLVPAAGGAYTVVATPVEFGGANITPSDVIKQGPKGLVGAIVIGPAGTTWAETDLVPDHQTTNAAAQQRATRASATLTSSGTRDFVTVVQKGLGLRYKDGTPVEMVAAEGNIAEDAEDSGQMAINYGSEPLWFRFGLAPNTPLVPEGPGGASLSGVTAAHEAFLNVRGNGDPVTPVFTAAAGAPVRMHLLMPTGSPRASSFTLHGHLWQRAPYVCPNSAKDGLAGKCLATGYFPTLAGFEVASRAIGTEPARRLHRISGSGDAGLALGHRAAQRGRRGRREGRLPVHGPGRPRNPVRPLVDPAGAVAVGRERNDLALALSLAAVLAAGSARASPAPPPASAVRVEGAGRIVKDGVVVEFTAGSSGTGGKGPLVEGEFAEVRFKMTDAASGRPVPGLKPAAWMDMSGVVGGMAGEQRACKDKVALYLQGSVGIRPMVDLNSYYLLVMNQDASVSVIDPVVSMTGNTSLFASIILRRPAADWVRSADQKRLYVSLPRAGEVAVVDAETFRVVAGSGTGGEPMRMALQADGRYLWVGNDAKEPGRGGVTVDRHRDVEGGPGRSSTGSGHHEIALLRRRAPRLRHQPRRRHRLGHRGRHAARS